MEPTNEKSCSRRCIGVRHVQFTFFFFSLVIHLGQRTCLSVTIIAMTDDNPPNSDIPTYPQWRNVDVILASFFLAYMLLQPIAGQLGERFGPKWFLVGTMISESIFTGLIPVMASLWGPTGVIICRLGQGLNQGFLYPCLHILVSKWAPFCERTRVMSVVHSGTTLGNVIAMVLSGALSGSHLGWPYVFYVYSGVGISFAFLFGTFVVNSPLEHKRISEEELLYIQGDASTDQTKIPTPWKEILTSWPAWAIFASFSCQAWGNFTLLTEIPSFLNSFMHYDIKSNGQISALPYLVQFFVNYLASPLADFIIARNILSVSATRKIFNACGTLFPALVLLILGFVDHSHKNVTILLLILAVGSDAFTNSGALVNVVDLSPNHAGTVMGLTNGPSQIFSVFGPMTVGFLGDEKTNMILWRKVFWLASAVYVVGGTFFIVCSSGELQSWNGDDRNEEKKEKGVLEEKV